MTRVRHIDYGLYDVSESFILVDHGFDISDPFIDQLTSSSIYSRKSLVRYSTCYVLSNTVILSIIIIVI